MRKQHVIDWIEKVGKSHPDLFGFSICPFARSAQYEILEVSLEHLPEPNPKKDVIIYIVEDSLDLKSIQDWVDHYNERHPDWDYFEDTYHVNNYIGSVLTSNGKYNLILAQPKKKLREIREKLAKTSYYSLWDEDYLKKILRDDIDIFKKHS